MTSVVAFIIVVLCIVAVIVAIRPAKRESPVDTQTAKLQDYLGLAAKNGASSVRLRAGTPPEVLLDGEWRRINLPALDAKEFNDFSSALSSYQSSLSDIVNFVVSRNDNEQIVLQLVLEHVPDTVDN